MGKAGKGHKNPTKLKLTPNGARSLRFWLESHQISQTEWGAHIGETQMQANRIIRRIGLLSADQVGETVSFVGGELTAVELVGGTQARRVPQLTPIDRDPCPAPSTPLSVQPVSGPAPEVDQVLERRYSGATLDYLLAQAEELIRDRGTSRNLKARLILGMVEQIAGKARQRERTEKHEPPAQDAELQRKLEAQDADMQLRVARMLEVENGPIRSDGVRTGSSSVQSGVEPSAAAGGSSRPDGGS